MHPDRLQHALRGRGRAGCVHGWCPAGHLDPGVTTPAQPRLPRNRFPRADAGAQHRTDPVAAGRRSTRPTVSLVGCCGGLRPRHRPRPARSPPSARWPWWPRRPRPVRRAARAEEARQMVVPFAQTYGARRRAGGRPGGVADDVQPALAPARGDHRAGAGQRAGRRGTCVTSRRPWAPPSWTSPSSCGRTRPPGRAGWLESLLDYLASEEGSAALRRAGPPPGTRSDTVPAPARTCRPTCPRSLPRQSCPR